MKVVIQVFCQSVNEKKTVNKHAPVTLSFRYSDKEIYPISAIYEI